MRSDNEISTCPRCGKQFSCSKSGKCWCYEVFIPPDKLEEIDRLYDRCLCPDCLKEYADPEIKEHKKTL
jgi:ribosomal protein L34E